MTPFEFRQDLGRRKTKSRCYRVACLRDPKFSRFETMLQYSETQTHDDSIYRASIASHGKNSLIHDLLFLPISTIVCSGL